MNAASSSTRNATTRSRHIERASVTMPDPELAEAIARFEALDDLVARMLLAQEIARTRQAELTLAYDNVVAVASGFRTRRDDSGRERPTREPCVVFVVRNKWSAKRRTMQCIPGHLLTYGTVEGCRALLAVPTDVRQESAFVDVRPHGPSAVTIEQGAEAGTGTLTCMAEFLDARQAPTRRLLSALHVLSISVDSGAAALPSGARVSTRNTLPVTRFATSSPVGGHLAPSPAISFDAQLAIPDADPSPDAARALADVAFDEAQPFAADYDALLRLVAQDLPIEIVVPTNHDGFQGGPRARIGATFGAHLLPGLSIPYVFRFDGSIGEWEVQHRELLQFTPLGGGKTLPGDSGSAIVCWLTDTTCCLLGMHIAGHEIEGFSYAIPAWQLFDPRNYAGTLDGASRFRPVRA